MPQLPDENGNTVKHWVSQKHQHRSRPHPLDGEQQLIVAGVDSSIRQEADEMESVLLGSWSYLLPAIVAPHLVVGKCLIYQGCPLIDHLARSKGIVPHLHVRQTMTASDMIKTRPAR